LWFIYRRFNTSNATLGAILLAGSLTNATYQGLPILSDQLGALGTAIAVQYDFFAQTPLLLTLGILMAKTLGHHEGSPESWYSSLIKVPALWAALIGLYLNQAAVPVSEPFIGWLETLSQPVIPLMLLSIGLGLRLESIRFKDLPFLAPVVIAKLFLLPATMIVVAHGLGLSDEIILGLTLEAAMSSIVIAIIVSDRYHLDSHKFIEIVTITLLLSLFTLPLWKWLLVGS